MGTNHGELHGIITPRVNLQGIVQASVSGGGGTKNYEKLTNKPSINGHTLVGDSNFEDIGLHFMTNTEIRDLLRRN